MTSWNKSTEKALSNIFHKLKQKRVEMFIEALQLGPDDTILDLGSEDGSYLSTYYPHPQNITIADINEGPMQRGVEKHGLKGYRVIPVEGQLPFEDGEYDAVWCNSVIEHVTIPRDQLGDVSNREFAESADKHQAFFAQEIARIGKKYFVQTPNVHFPLESHSWLPLVHYLPHPTRYQIGVLFRKIWIKQWTSDFLLYNRSRFEAHFPDATEYRVERAAGLAKSFIALRA